jgi:uncharacterized protein (TIGR02996 family)
MGGDDGFLAAIAEDPDDLVTHLVYADWLDERGQEQAAACLRTWCQVVSLPYDEDAYRHLQSRIGEYRSHRRLVDEAWAQRVEKARAWVSVSLVENVARLHLRTRHGRKIDRQWIDRIDPPQAWLFDGGVWRVHYWRDLPPRWKAKSRCEKGCMHIDRITLEIQDWR